MCLRSQCLEAHARAGMVVDTQELERMLVDLLPHVLHGSGVGRVSDHWPWPSAAPKNGSTGLWCARPAPLRVVPARRPSRGPVAKSFHRSGHACGQDGRDLRLAPLPCRWDVQ